MVSRLSKLLSCCVRSYFQCDAIDTEWHFSNLRYCVLNSSRNSTGKVLRLSDLLQIYTLATLTNDLKLGNTVFEAMSDLKFDWDVLKKLVDSEKNFDPQGARDLVSHHLQASPDLRRLNIGQPQFNSWSFYSLSAADAHAKIGCPASACHPWLTASDSLKDGSKCIMDIRFRWASLSHVKSLKDLDRLGSTAHPEGGCHEDCRYHRLEPKIEEYRKALKKLPPVVTMRV